MGICQGKIERREVRREVDQGLFRLVRSAPNLIHFNFPRFGGCDQSGFRNSGRCDASMCG